MNIGQLIASLGLDSSQFNSALASAKAAMGEMDKRIKTSQAGMQQFAGSMDSVGQKFRTFGYLATATLTVPILAVGKSMIKSAADFEFSMTKIEGLVGINQETIKEWSTELLKMGREVAQSPNKLAESLYFVSSAGFKTNEALELTRMAALGASTGMGDATDIAKLLVSSMNAYAGSGLTAAKVMDVFTAAVREGAVEPEGFASAVGSVLPIAAKLKVSLEEVVASMASMSLTGSNAAQAGTYLRNILQKLIKPSKQTQEALGEMGTSSEQLVKVIQNQGLLAGLGEMSDLLEKYPDKIGQVFPNIRTLIGYLSLTGDQFENNKRILYEVSNSTGDFNIAIEKASNTIRWKYDAAMAAVTETKIKMGAAIADILLPLLDTLTKKITELSTWFTSLNRSQQESVVNIGLLVAALGPLSLLISTIIYSLSGLIKVLSFLWANPFVALTGAIILLLPKISDLIFKTQQSVKHWGDHRVVIDANTKALLDYTKALKKIPEGSQTILDLQKTQKDTFDEIQKTLSSGLWKKMNARQLDDLITKIENFKVLLEDIKLNNPMALMFGDSTMKKIDSALAQLGVRLKSIQESTTVAEASLGLIEAKEKEIEAIQDKINTAPNKALIDSYIVIREQLEKQLELLKALGLSTGLSEATLMPLPAEYSAKPDVLDFTKMPEYGTPTMSSMKTLQDDFQTIADYMKTGKRLADNYSQAISALGFSLGMVISGQEGAWQSFFNTMLNGVNSIITELLTMAIAGTLAIEGSKAGIIGLLAAASIGLGIITATMNKPVEMANGGLAYGDTLARVGEYPGASSNPEVIAPLSKLQSIIGSNGGMQGEVRFVIEQDKLVGILSKANKRNSIY